MRKAIVGAGAAIVKMAGNIVRTIFQLALFGG